MAIVFTYTEVANTTEVTGGTVGTPADFDDFVTADRAGTAELLAAETCTTNHTLTYQVRPVEDLAITINFILSGTSAGGGDTLDVTGTLFDGSAQTDNIDVSGGDATYNGSYKWKTITDIDCTGWADGTLQVTQGRWGVIWDYGNSQYKLDSFFMIGDDSIATHFRTDNEVVTWSAGVAPNMTYPLFKNNATLYSGKLIETLGVDGSVFNFWTTGAYPSANVHFNSSWEGAALLYGCRINIKTGNRLYILNDSSVQLVDTVINFETGTHDVFLMASIGMTRGVLASTDGGAVMEPSGSSPTIDGLITNMSTLQTWYGGTVSASNISMFNSSTQHLQEGVGQTMNLIDAVPLSPTLITIGHASGVINQKYTVNIHVADKDGTNLETVAVLCQDADGNTTGGFTSVNTDANGDIAEQTIIYKQWTTTSETLKDYSPHKFTLSKAGYETLILENITVDAPIVWHLELRASKQPPAPWHEGGM